MALDPVYTLRFAEDGVPRALGASPLRAGPGPPLPGADPLWLVAQFPAPLGGPQPTYLPQSGAGREGTVRPPG